MPHHGEYEHVKEWLQDHDTDEVSESPPVQNTWYTAFDAEDVRLIWCLLFQVNDEAAAKDIEVMWTIDGTPYFGSVALASNTWNYVQRSATPSLGGTGGLAVGAVQVNAAFNVDKRGLDFEAEVRMTSVPGTNQVLLMQCVRETLEVT